MSGFKTQATRIKAIIIGASAGGIESLRPILGKLPQDFSLPIFIVVHLPPERPSLLPDVFGALLPIPVHEASDKEHIENGTVYFAPPDYHLLFERDRTFALSSDEEVNFSRPSIDVAFESAVDVYGSGLLGIVLSGANEDGAAGLRDIIDRGGIGLVQAPATAPVRTMPESAIRICPEAVVLTPDEIGVFLRSCGP